MRRLLATVVLLVLVAGCSAVTGASFAPSTASMSAVPVKGTQRTTPLEFPKTSPGEIARTTWDEGKLTVRSGTAELGGTDWYIDMACSGPPDMVMFDVLDDGLIVLSGSFARNQDVGG